MINIKNSIKKISKDFFSRQFTQKTIAWITNIYIKFVYKTSRVIIKCDRDDLKKLLSEGNGILLLCWHGRIMLTPMIMKSIFRGLLKTNKITLLASNHRDGKIVGEIARTFNYNVLEGSTIDPKKGSTKNKKSLTSLREMLRKFYSGEVCAVGIDGPRGPLYTINTNLTDLVKKTNTPIMLASISSSFKKQFNTWDRFQMTLPFSKVLVEISEPIKINKEDVCESINSNLERKLRQMTEITDNKISSNKNK